jgi:hypothetical protein
MPQLNAAVCHGTSFGSSWKQLYERAILELDSNELPGRIADARHAIFDRAEEILTEPAGGENHELHDALRDLRRLNSDWAGSAFQALVFFFEQLIELFY